MDIKITKKLQYLATRLDDYGAVTTYELYILEDAAFLMTMLADTLKESQNALMDYIDRLEKAGAELPHDYEIVNRIKFMLSRLEE